MDENKSVDLLGIKPVGDALNTTVTKSFEGIEGFLRLVCAPALQEVGLLFRDKVRSWRLQNILKILNRAKDKIEYYDNELQIKAHPRVALSIIENGSLNDDDEIQNLWAGLFASSCTKDGQDDENLIFVDLLKQLTSVQAKILKYSCEKSQKLIFKNDLIIGDHLDMDFDGLVKLTSVTDIYRLDRELDHLRSLELIGSTMGGGGFSLEDEHLSADIAPTSLALSFYVRCQGFIGSPKMFWEQELIPFPQKNN